MIWREKRVLLIILSALLLANTVFFFTYRVQYQSRLDALDARLEQAENELRQARSARMRTERMVESYRQVERDVLLVFNEHWSTQPARLTALITEVKRLASMSSLVPPSYTFDRDRETKTTLGPARRRGGESLGASEVGISFGVQGTYPQVRRLINLLELSHQFVIIDGITLAAVDNQNLSLNLQLKTLFRDEAPPGSASSNRL